MSSSSNHNTTMRCPMTAVDDSVANPFRFVPLTRFGRDQAKRLMEEEVSLDDLERMTTIFYDKASQDATLDQFIRSHDDPHGPRFAKWIHDRLTGSGLWERDCRTRSQEPADLGDGSQIVVNSLFSAHVAAVYSPKRPSRERGLRFKLDACRVWMRLHFWALRESGIMQKSPSFADYYVRFIANFMRFYEDTALVFARESLRWSANPMNIEEYVLNGHRMKDVLGLSFSKALKQLPTDEADDAVWPFNSAPESSNRR